CGGLDQQDHGGVLIEHPGAVHSGAFAAGECWYDTGEEMLDLAGGDDLLAKLWVRRGPGVPAEVEDFLRCEGHTDGVVLGEHRPPTCELLAVQLADVLARDEDLPGVDVEVASDRGEQGGLSGAVRPDQRGDLAGGSGEADVVQQLVLVHAEMQVFYCDAH